ncbi:MAG: 50S ribosomal protein L23 [Patescibacteria group bacterium]|nr:50S ribosomal protein L23 [Patescibacteria group bacterium]
MSILKPFKKSKKTDIVSEEIQSKEPEKAKEKPITHKTTEGILKKIRISEKGTDLNKNNQYVFLVRNTANKNEIKKEVSRRYDVKVSAVNIIRMRGKVKRLGSKFGRRPSFKKAIITLKQGHKIEIT